MKAVTKLLNQPSAAVMRQMAFIEDKTHFSSAFGHRKQNTPRGAFGSDDQNGLSAAIFQLISPLSKPVDAFLRINASSVDDLATTHAHVLTVEDTAWKSRS
jgi:hypothetical protein